ncbi:MAG: hypothetical protein AVDCRST_MAG87-547, partial [uncultured Thermomicrobiales bacterium]
ARIIVRASLQCWARVGLLHDRHRARRTFETAVQSTVPDSLARRGRRSGAMRSIL